MGSTFGVIVAGALLAAAAAPAAAEMVVYRDQAGNIHGATGDGVRSIAYTSDGVAGGRQYIAPGIDDQGNVMVASPATDKSYRIVDRGGVTVRGPFLITLPLCSISPFAGPLDPAGDLIAFAYYRGSGTCTTLAALRTEIFSARGLNAAEAFPSEEGMTSPAWTTRPPGIGLMGIVNGDVRVRHYGPPVGPMQTLIPNPNPLQIEFASVEPARHADLVMVEVALAGTGARQREIFLYRSDGTTASPAVPLCALTLPGAISEQSARPRYSSDGSRISWTATDGVRIATAPTVPAGQPEGFATVCQTGGERLLIAGGRDAAWSPADLPAVGTPGRPGGPADPTGPGPSNPAGLAPTARPGAPALVVTRRGAGVRMRVTMRLPRTLAGRRVDIQLAQGRRWVRVARIARVPANGRAVRTVTLRRPALRTGASVRVRLVVAATVRARAAIGQVRTARVPGRR